MEVHSGIAKHSGIAIIEILPSLKVWLLQQRFVAHAALQI